MIVIDGRQSELDQRDFKTLDQIFVKVMERGDLNDRVVTDVFLNDEPFTEIYPRQAEDIDAKDIRKLEIKSVPVTEMAVSITREMYKVINLMAEAGNKVAAMFRRADDSEALELYQDLLDVIRNFIGMIGLLRDEFSLKEHSEFKAAADQLNTLFTEMSEVLENEDWILLADLLEYEFFPAVDKWKKVVAMLREDIRIAGKE
ncbi:MAG: hypothetical protein PHV85_08225 [Desulfovibrionaceae bacterium]|nr:hypothetical protein [Desulfovibrionaceae bacterium]